MKKLIAVGMVAVGMCGCLTTEPKSPQPPKSGTYEYWGKANGKDIYILWIDGKEYNEKQAKKLGIEWNPIVTTTTSNEN